MWVGLTKRWLTRYRHLCPEKKITFLEDHLFYNFSIPRLALVFIISMMLSSVFLVNTSSVSASEGEGNFLTTEVAYNLEGPISDLASGSVFQEVADSEEMTIAESTKDGAEEIIIGILLLVGFTVLGVGVAAYGVSSR